VNFRYFNLYDGNQIGLLLIKINVREYRRGNQKRKIQRNWQECIRRRKTKQKYNTICVRHLLQTTGGKDESLGWTLHAWSVLNNHIAIKLLQKSFNYWLIVYC